MLAISHKSTAYFGTPHAPDYTALTIYSVKGVYRGRLSLIFSDSDSKRKDIRFKHFYSKTLREG